MISIPTVNASASYDTVKSEGGRRARVDKYLKDRPKLHVRSHFLNNQCVRLDIWDPKS